ncbi:hypothetical protein HYU07_02165, partial [Candidatus Woesearchaeota archaeon]|nr:hypothetical protein [Candidatus Woesearchaeota archaeon]
MGSTHNFVDKNGIFIPQMGSIGGKSGGLVRSLDMLGDVGYKAPPSILIPAESLD